MGKEWDERVRHDYRYWMSDGVQSDEDMWATGVRDFALLVDGLPRESLTEFHILDVGCGVGRILRAAAEATEKAVGIDVSEEALNKARNLLSGISNAELVKGNGLDFSELKASSFDLIISFAALGSIPARILSNYLREFSRVLKIGGRLRVQIYLGQEQGHAEEDTLALRAYEKDRFISVLNELGFKKDYLSEVKLPFEVSDYEKGCVAFVLGAEKISETNVSADQIYELLLSKPEEILGDNFKGSETACLVSLSRASELSKSGDLDGAMEALRLSKESYQGNSVEVLKFVREIEGAIDELRDASTPVGQLARKVERDKPLIKENNITVVETEDGPQVRFKGIVLSHATTPKKAGLEWAKRALRSIENQDLPYLFIGMGDLYFIDSFQEILNKKIVVYESNRELISFFPKERLSNYEFISDQSTLNSWIDANKDKGGVNLLVLPAAALYLGEVVADVRRKVRSRAMATKLRPEIGIVGPMYGGTLPIAGYLYHACRRLSLKAEFIDLSAYYSGFTSFDKFLSKPYGKSVLENQYIELMSELVYQIVEEKKLQIVISVALAPLSPKVLERLRAKGVITVHWFMEDTRRFTTWKEIAKYYDYFFVIQKGQSIDEVKDAGGRGVYYLPLACEPQAHRKRNLSVKEKEEFGSKLSFVGAGYNNRRHIFSKLADLDIKLWGSEWPDMLPFKTMVQREGARVNVDEYTKIFSGTEVNINLHSSHERDGIDPTGDFVNPRTFELASCEAFQLVDRRSLLADLFEAGKEVIVFDSLSELREQIDFYLKNPEARKEIVKNARERVLKEHTYAHRLETILEYVMADFGDELAKKIEQSPWPRTLEAAKQRPELLAILEKKRNAGEDPVLDALVSDSLKGQGKLSEVEMKLLFLHHMRGQITHIEKLRGGARG